MADSNKKEIERIHSKIHSNKENDIIEGIEKMRTSGNSQMLAELLSVLETNPPIEVTDKIFQLLNDLKVQNSAEMLIQFIENHKNSPHLKELISACWQNGLDYSQNIELFTSLALENDYLVAIEVFSVIQENIELVSEAKRFEIAGALNSKLKNQNDPEKKKIIHEIISLIQPVSGPFIFNKNVP